LMNLLSNAVKFTERGGVTLRLRTEDGKACFDVIDTGIGIPQDQIDRIYDPFWQLERPNTRRAGGTGLGLSVSRRYTRLLRGELSVESNPDEGTRVTVSLPLGTSKARGDG
ncbi:MAG: ATP-binding protein, partial [Longimicrobiales bacterium]